MKPDLLNSALQYLKKGFSIIPRNPTMDEALGKKPFTKWEKFQKQRADERQIREWWQRWPTAMIGAICGPISGFFAVDADTPEAELELEQLFPDDLITPSTKTPHGNHILFADHPGIRNYNQNNGHIKFHVRGEGGFLILPPSVRENGLKYEWLVSPFDAPFAPAPLTLLNKINNCIKGGYGGEVNDHSKTTGLTTSDHKRPQRPQEVFTQGNRNEEIFHHAYALLKGGFKKEEVFQSIEFIAKNCIPPYPLSEARKSVESAWERFCEKKEERERSIADEIEDWVMTTDGHFLTTDGHKCLQLTTRREKKTADMAFLRLKDRGIIEKVGNRNGCYRKIDREIKRIDLKAPRTPRLSLRWPMGVEDFVYMNPKSIIIICGETDGGKTAFNFDFCAKNLDSHKIHYFTSEMGQEGMQDRLSKYGEPMEFWEALDIIERENGFEDVVFPDAINIIDYLSVPIEKVWMIKEPIDRIFFKLNKGIAIISPQMGQGQSLPYGKYWGIERSCLAIALKKIPKEDNIAEIIKAKNWVNSKVRPTGLTAPFWCVDGCKIIRKAEWK